MIKSTTNSSDTILGYIDDAVKRAIGRAFDDAIEQAVKDAQDRRDEVIAQTALKLSTRMTMQDNGRQMVIAIEKRG